MRRFLTRWSVLLWIVLLPVVSARGAEPKIALSVVTERPDALYSVGEKVGFVVTLTEDGRPACEGQVRLHAQPRRREDDCQRHGERFRRAGGDPRHARGAWLSAVPA